MVIFHSYVSLPEGRIFPWRFSWDLGLCQNEEERMILGTMSFLSIFFSENVHETRSFRNKRVGFKMIEAFR